MFSRLWWLPPRPVTSRLPDRSSIQSPVLAIQDRGRADRCRWPTSSAGLPGLPGKLYLRAAAAFPIFTEVEVEGAAFGTHRLSIQEDQAGIGGPFCIAGDGHGLPAIPRGTLHVEAIQGSSHGHGQDQPRVL
jgi:hypothetical protein